MTALVLSAGGMFGAYQAGAYKAIADLAPPDLVTGASVGALNGWPIAGGCTPDRLIERWLDPAAGDALKLFPNYGRRNGWFDPAALRAQTEQLWAEYRPRIPFGLVMVRLRGLKTCLVQYPRVTAEHLQATCSIPLFLPAVRIGGRRYMDGGLFDKLPIRAALEMGATRIVAVDSLPDPGIWWLRAGGRIASVCKRSLPYPSHLDLTIVSPSEALGDLNDAIFWKRKNVERWVALGMRDATRALREGQTDID